MACLAAWMDVARAMKVDVMMFSVVLVKSSDGRGSTEEKLVHRSLSKDTTRPWESPLSLDAGAPTCTR